MRSRVRTPPGPPSRCLLPSTVCRMPNQTPPERIPRHSATLEARRLLPAPGRGTPSEGSRRSVSYSRTKRVACLPSRIVASRPAAPPCRRSACIILLTNYIRERSVRTNYWAKLPLRRCFLEPDSSVDMGRSSVCGLCGSGVCAAGSDCGQW